MNMNLHAKKEDSAMERHSRITGLTDACEKGYNSAHAGWYYYVELPAVVAAATEYIFVIV